MIHVTITLGQLLIFILITTVLRLIWYQLEKRKWNHGICTKCNKGNYKGIRHDMTFIGHKCSNCNNEIFMFFDKITDTEKYIECDTKEYFRHIRKEKIKKLNKKFFN